MTASIKILTTSTIDSSPSILLISPNGTRVLINCGEGCQRSFLESTSDKVRSVNQICLTHIGYDATGGLPGLILTSADAAQSSSSNKNGEGTKNHGPPNVSKDESYGDERGDSAGVGVGVGVDEGGGVGVGEERQVKRIRKNNARSKKSGSLEIMGPTGTENFIHSLRHFMRRDNFQLNVSQGLFQSIAKPGDGVVNNKCQSKKHKKINNKQSSNEYQQRKGIFSIQSIPLKRLITTLAGDLQEVHLCSYLFTTTPIPGKFQVDKAKALNIPPGKMYAQLKAGQSVTFIHKSEDVTVHPHQVLEGGCDGIAVAIIYCPDMFVFDQLVGDTFGKEANGHKENTVNARDQLSKFKASVSIGDNDSIELEAMIHYTPKCIFESEKYQKWIQDFDSKVNHIKMHPMDEYSFDGGNEHIDGSPFKSAVLGAMARSLIRPDIYASPFPTLSHTTANESVPINNVALDTNNENVSPTQPCLNIINAQAHMEYALIPLSKKGLNIQSLPTVMCDFGISAEEHQQIHTLVQESLALKEASQILHENVSNSNDAEKNERKGELIFTGTGSAIPCKHRNVTGMYLQMNNGNGMFLDIGEGTVGQLIRTWNSETRQHDSQNEMICDKILSCKAVWISHPHADHHLGLIKFLSVRNSMLKSRNMQQDPVTVIASTSLLSFLIEYSRIDPTILKSYVGVDCKDTVLKNHNPALEKLNQSLGITGCISVPVSHCWHSYALVLDGTSFGRLVYSGDCRPSDRLVEIGKGAQLLIHEATFEDGMEEEAVLKRHSTVGEAITIGDRMKVQNLILTHFSQRYPRIPPIQKEGEKVDFPIAIAFDYMRVKDGDVGIAAKMTPSLRLLYPDSENCYESLDVNPHEPSANEILSAPGAFANKSNNMCK